MSRGVFVATQRALAHLGDGGRIINIGSINADRVPVPGPVGVRDDEGAPSQA